MLLLCEGCDRSQCQEGPSQGSEGWRDRHGAGIWNSLSHRVQWAEYQCLKILEGSKAVNAREAKPRKEFINCVILCLFAQNSSYLCLFSLLSHNVVQSQNGFYCVLFALKKFLPSICYNKSQLLFPSLLNKVIMDAWQHQGKKSMWRHQLSQK